MKKKRDPNQPEEFVSSFDDDGVVPINIMPALSGIEYDNALKSNPNTIAVKKKNRNKEDSTPETTE